MEYYFITGTSRGIGKALAEELLKRDNVHVTGIARHNTIRNDHFRIISADLSGLGGINSIGFPQLADAEKIVLVNNAGSLGEVGYVGQLSEENFNAVFSLNLMAPAALTNEFLRKYGNQKVPIIIANISSGAAKNPIDGWSAYCASKAGLEMFSRVLAEELAISAQKNIRVFSIAPGVVDTGMQDQIRTSKSENFSRIQQFLDYKSSGQLADPLLIAQKLLIIFDCPDKFPDTLISLREISTPPR